MLNFSSLSALQLATPLFLCPLTVSCGNDVAQTEGKDPRLEISLTKPKPSDESSKEKDFPAGASGPNTPPALQGNTGSGTAPAAGSEPPSNTPDNANTKPDAGAPQPTPPQNPPTAPAAPASKATLSVAVNNLRNTNGNFCLSIFASADGFPDSAEKAIFAECFSIAERSFTITLKDVPSGRYAVAGWHDENKDKQLNYNFLGIPKEGLAFSENGKPRIAPPPGPPSFDSIAFDVGSEAKTTQMKTTYLLDLL